MATPRKRASTVYKRYIKEQSGFDGIPLSSQKSYLENYKTSMDTSKVVPHTSVETDVSIDDEAKFYEEWNTGSATINMKDNVNCEIDEGTENLLQHDTELFQGVHQEYEDIGYSNEDTNVVADDASTCSSEIHDFPVNDDGYSDDEPLGTCEKESDHSTNTDHVDMTSPIFSGSQITLTVSLLLIMTFITKYSITSEGTTELLQLINLHCTAVNCLPKTLYAFKHFFSHIQHPLVHHKYCSHCLLGIDSSTEDICQNPLCSKCLKTEGNVSGFIEIPVKEQLESLFKRPSFLQKLSHRKKRDKKNHDAIEDIYDGRLYEELISNGTLNGDYDLTLTFNTDGAKPFRSSKTSLWPIYFMINELPFVERRMPENMILAGIWYGSKKPQMTGFLNPFMTSLKQFEQGLFFDIGEATKVKVKVIMIASSCDLPARACVCAMNQYNGDSSCVKCSQTGQVVKVGKGHTRVFPPMMNDLDGPSRSDESVKQDAVSAVELKKPVHGIKGPSWFSFLTHYSFTRSTGIDYMHGVLLGVTKLLFSLWFGSKFNKETFSISQHAGIVNKRLMKIKPPNYVSRLPRTMLDSDYWKASEWKYWLLYYAPAILYGLLDTEYYTHFLLFAEAIHILLKDSILPMEIQRSRFLIAQFVAMFPVMYTQTVMTLNVHQLVHLPDDVRNIGPLWSFSCFPFEDANGFLLQLFNGTQHIDKQIAHAVAVMQKIPDMLPAIKKNTLAYDLLCKLQNKVPKNKCTFLGNNIYIVGATRFEQNLSPVYMSAVDKKMSCTVSKIISFKRVKIGSDTFFSRSYSRVHLRNSYTVSFEEDDEISYGYVEFFVQVLPLCHCSNLCVCIPRNFGLIHNFTVVRDHMGVSYIKCVKKNFETVTAVDVHKIKQKCVLISHDDDTELLFNVPNTLEKD